MGEEEKGKWAWESTGGFGGAVGGWVAGGESEGRTEGGERRGLTLDSTFTRPTRFEFDALDP